ncbi:MAG: hypothetical protein EZS28_043728, partial [Streblomastix strix]
MIASSDFFVVTSDFVLEDGNKTFQLAEGDIVQAMKSDDEFLMIEKDREIIKVPLKYLRSFDSNTSS